jgi:hypothetical protein
MQEHSIASYAKSKSITSLQLPAVTPAFRSLLSHTCCHTPAVTHLLSHTCCHTPAVTHLLSHTCCAVTDPFQLFYTSSLSLADCNGKHQSKHQSKHQCKHQCRHHSLMPALAVQATHATPPSSPDPDTRSMAHNPHPAAVSCHPG